MEWIKEKMHQARLQRNQIQAQGAVAAQGNDQMSEPEEASSRFSDFFTLNHKLSWLAGGMALGGVIVIMVANGLSGGVSERNRNVVELPLQLSSDNSEGMRKDISHLTEQVQTLTSTVSDLETKLLRIQAATNSTVAIGNEPASDASQQQDAVSGIEARLKTLPSPAAGISNAGASDGKDTGKSGDPASTPLVVANEITQPASGMQAQETIIDKGPWVINLASLPRKVDAERFMTNAESKGVVTDLYQVTVKGKNYWRVHVPGFATADQARAEASLIKEKLGLKDAWVAKR